MGHIGMLCDESIERYFELRLDVLFECFGVQWLNAGTYGGGARPALWQGFRRSNMRHDRPTVDRVDTDVRDAWILLLKLLKAHFHPGLDISFKGFRGEGRNMSSSSTRSQP